MKRTCIDNTAAAAKAYLSNREKCAACSRGCFDRGTNNSGLLIAYSFAVERKGLIVIEGSTRFATLLVRIGDINDPLDAEAFYTLLELYMKDPQGSFSNDCHPDRNVIDRLRSYSHLSLFFVETPSEVVGMAVCFIGFSTFRAKELINIHDFIIAPKWRRKGAGRVLMAAVLEYAVGRDCCKVTLEVREDNFVAQQFYRDLGFNEEPVPMRFWTKYL